MISFLENIQFNQFLPTIIGLGGAGMLTFWLKDIPRKIYELFRREFTTELFLTSHNSSFHDMLKWIQEEYRDKNFRRMKLSNGRWGGDEVITSIGYGFHMIKFKKRILFIQLKREETDSHVDKEIMSLTKLGRSRKLFDELIEKVQKMNEDKSKIKAFKHDKEWQYIKNINKRSMDSIFIEEHKKKKLINSLDEFLKREKWYEANGIPYHLGILLYGPPGTGKTSLIKSIASHLDFSIYYISPNRLSEIERAMSSLPDRCVVVIEDIDGNLMMHSRDHTSDDELSDIKAMFSISEILNSLDGLFSTHGRILIATTNHLEKLDEALVRPGRFDIKMEVGYVNKEIFKAFMQKFFPSEQESLDKIELKNNIGVSVLQNYVLEGKPASEIVDLVKIQ